MQASQQVYPTGTKARAFFGGLVRKGSPFLGVAIEGLRKYDRPDLGEFGSAQRARYLATVRKSASFEMICGILKAGCTPNLQDELAKILKGKYEGELKKAIGLLSGIIIDSWRKDSSTVHQMSELPAAVSAQLEDTELMVPIARDLRKIVDPIRKMKREAASVLERRSIDSDEAINALQTIKHTPLEVYEAAVQSTQDEVQETRQKLH